MTQESNLIPLERIVLSSLLKQPQLFNEFLMRTVTHDFFVSREHTAVYKTLVEMKAIGMSFDYHTVLVYLLKQQEEKEVELEACLNAIAQTEPDLQAFEQLVRLLDEEYLRRKALTQLSTMKQQLHFRNNDVYDIVNEGVTALHSIVHPKRNDRAEHIIGLARNQFQRLKDIQDKKSAVAGIPTGYKQLDAALSGILPGYLYVIGSRPSVGKTTFLINLLLNALLETEQQYSALFYSPETSAGNITQRMLSCTSEVMYEKIARGILDEEELAKVQHNGFDRIKEIDLTIDDNPIVRVEDIRRKLQFSRDRPYDIIFIDQLQQIVPAKGRYRDEEVSIIMKELKLLAKEFKIPVVVTSQLNRTADLRKEGNRMPQLSDLRDSGGIEQEADVVMFLYRPEYYDITNDEFGEAVRGETHVRIAKNRTGPLDTIKLRALLHIQKFIADDYLEPTGPYRNSAAGPLSSETTWTNRFEEEREKHNKDLPEFDEDTPF